MCTACQGDHGRGSAPAWTVGAHQLTTHTGQFTAEVDCTLGSRCASVSDCQDNPPNSLPPAVLS
jgi:hypothetical protein